MICATAIPARKEITFLASFTELMIALWRLACFHLLSSIRLPNGLTRYLAKRKNGLPYNRRARKDGLYFYFQHPARKSIGPGNPKSDKARQAR